MSRNNEAVKLTFAYATEYQIQCIDMKLEDPDKSKALREYIIYTAMITWFLVPHPDMA